MKFRRQYIYHTQSRRSREGAWIEMLEVFKNKAFGNGRSREGAWIEIVIAMQIRIGIGVAPARERGLKSQKAADGFCCGCRSREGAWIEIS